MQHKTKKYFLDIESAISEIEDLAHAYTKT